MEINDIISSLNGSWIMLTAITGFLYYFYKKETAKLEKWQDEYFYEILVPFRMEYLKNVSMSIREYINKIDIYNKGYVPSYMFHLVKQNKYEEIRQILIVDYEHNYPSLKRTSFKSLTKFMNVVNFFKEFVMIFMFAICLFNFFLFTYLILLEVHHFWQSNMWSTINIYGIEVLIIWMLAVFLLLFILGCRYILLYFCKKDFTDCYSSKKEIVDKIIKQKIKIYGEIESKLIY